MSLNIQEIGTDYDVDYVEPEDDTFYDDFIQIESLDKEIDQLFSSTIAVESYGMNPSSFGVMKASGLLAGTSLDALGMENFSYSGPNDPESEMATEALVDKIKEKSAEWSAKILSFVKTVKDKVLNTITSLWDKITALGKDLGSKTWDLTKTAGRTIKAHPFKTVLALVVAAAAVVALAVYVSKGPASVSQSDVDTFVKNARYFVSQVGRHGGNGSVKMSEVKKGVKFTYEWIPNGEMVTLENISVEEVGSKLGWTASAVKTVMGQLSKVGDGLKSALTSLGSTTMSVLKMATNYSSSTGAKVEKVVAGKTGSKIAGWASKEVINKIYSTALWSAIGVTTMLIKQVALKAYTTVLSTFTALKPAVQPQTA